MLWIIFLTVIQVCGGISRQQEGEERIYNDLSITYDHCRAPQTLNRETWTCECPGSLTKKGDECICEDCLFDTKNESYVERQVTELPEYVAGFIKDLDADSEGIVSRMFHDSTRRRKRKRMDVTRRKMREFARKITVAAGSICDVGRIEGRRSAEIIHVPKFDGPFVRFLNSLRLGKFKRPEMIRLKKIDWNKARIFNLKRVPTYPFIVRPEVLQLQEEEQGMTHSETSIGDIMHGKVRSGEDRAYGLVSNLFGTGSLSMGAGQGGALASAYSGEGLSVSGLESFGGKAYGSGLIGKKAHRGTSTTTLLIGEGDAIGTNSLSKKASASATAVATKKVSTAGSTAFGAASAAASATPGRGNADGSASFGESLQASANVTGKVGKVAESASVGREKDDLRDFVNRQKQSRISDGIDHGKVFSGVRRVKQSSSDFSVFGISGDESDSAWLY